MKKSRLVFVPAPGMGHLVSTVEFAKLLINHDDRLSITVFIVKSPGSTNVDAYTDSLTSSPNFPERLQLLHLPADESQSAQYLHQPIKNSIPRVRQAVSDLVQESHSDPDSPGLAAFVVDMFCTAMIDVANEMGVPAVVFYTSGAAFLGLMFHLHPLKEQGILDTTAPNFKDSGTELIAPSYENPMPANVLPSILLEKEWEGFVDEFVKGLRKAKGILVNTFEELESQALHSLSQGGDTRIYPVGPILSAKDDETGQRGSDIMEWLDDQPESLVLFLCFGSMGYFSEDQVREIARALENSGVRFLWSLRKPPPEGSRSITDYSDPAEVLPVGFLDRTSNIGKVIGWAPQAQVLAHKAVGGFVSHCGWNSILESVYFGVPIATWPLYAEQQPNAFELVRELKMAVEISLDYRTDSNKGSAWEVISAERIEKGIKEVMERESEVRKKVNEISELSRKALKEGGSSYSYLGRFIDDLLSHRM